MKDFLFSPFVTFLGYLRRETLKSILILIIIEKLAYYHLVLFCWKLGKFDSHHGLT
jgi:hypothetical protein